MDWTIILLNAIVFILSYIACYGFLLMITRPLFQWPRNCVGLFFLLISETK